MLYQLNTEKRQDEANTADDKDARVEVGDDRRFHPSRSMTSLASFEALSSATSRRTTSTGCKKNATERPISGVVALSKKFYRKNQKYQSRQLMRCEDSKLPPASRPSPSPQKVRTTPGSSAPGTGRRGGPGPFHFRTRVAKARAECVVQLFLTPTSTTCNSAVESSDNQIRTTNNIDQTKMG